MSKKKSNYYVDPEELISELKKSFEHDELTNRCALMLEKMVVHIQRPFKYPNDDVRYEIKSGVVEELIRKWRKCNVDGNPFSFFTQTIKMDLYAYFKDWHKKKKHTISYSNIFDESV